MGRQCCGRCLRSWAFNGVAAGVFGWRLEADEVGFVFMMYSSSFFATVFGKGQGLSFGQQQYFTFTLFQHRSFPAGAMRRRRVAYDGIWAGHQRIWSTVSVPLEATTLMPAW